MALIKETETKFKITASYWRISLISIDKRRNVMSIVLDLFMEKGAEASLDTYVVDDFMISSDNYEMFNKYFMDEGKSYKDIYTACYKYCKDNVEFFKDAVDDEEELMKL